MGTFKKIKRTNERAILIIAALFLFVSLVLLVINYSVDRSIGWSLIPIGALILVLTTGLPLVIMKKNKTLVMFIGLAITLIPFLFLIQARAHVKGWAIPLALPIAGLSLLAFGVSLIAFSNIRRNKYYPVALTVFLFGIIVNFGIGVIVSRFLNEENVFDISKVSTLSGSALISLSLFVAGLIKGNKPSPKREVLSSG